MSDGNAPNPTERKTAVTIAFITAAGAVITAIVTGIFTLANKPREKKPTPPSHGGIKIQGSGNTVIQGNTGPVKHDSTDGK